MGKSKSPNMSGVNQAARENAALGREQLALAREQYADDKVRQAEFDPIFKKILQSSLEQQDLSAAQSAEQWKSYRDTWMPLEAKLAKQAAEFDTPQRRDAEAAAAAADVGIQYGQQERALDRDLARSNTTLSSGKALAMKSGMALAQARDTASAQGNARRQVEQAGIALVDNASRFGRNMTSTGIETARLSLGAGQSAGGAMGQQQSIINSGLAGAQGFYQGAVGANSSAGNMLLGAAQLQQQNNQFNAGFQQELLGSALGGGAAYMAGGSAGLTKFLTSSESTKDVEGDVDPDAALQAVKDTPVKAWRYKKGLGDGDTRLRIGPMAEDVAKTTGMGDGKTLDVATELGTLRAAVQSLAKKVEDQPEKASTAPRRLTLGGVKS